MQHTATEDQIRAGLVTDVYFERTREILKARGIDKEVRAEFIAKGMPGGEKWAVFSGLEECLDLLKDLPLNVRAMKEGSVFRSFEPVMEIHGKYLDFAKYETPLLGFICQASGIATMAARFKKAAGRRPVISFGARRMHPALAPLVERNAYLGGCDGVSIGLGARVVGIEPTGTMPHALILIMGDTVEATKAFHEIIDARVKRVSLVDTFHDEKFEALNVARALGKDLYAVRLDTPGSRRGDFLKIMEEVRWELDLRGYQDVKIFLSGGLDEHKIPEYNRYADAYGVGTAISNAKVIDFSMDIIEIEGEPVAKRGKRSGSKDVYRCARCFEDRITPAGAKPVPCHCGGLENGLLLPVMTEGTVTSPVPKVGESRSFVLEQLEKVCIKSLG